MTELTPVAVYGCEPDETVLFRELGPRSGVLPIISEAAVSEANVEMAAGSRCISVGHKAPVPHAVLAALSRLGVEYVSTRSIGVNHIDVSYARGVGITVGNVAYSPDSVADYTVMLILMAVRDAQSMIRRVGVHDYRLSGTRGRELRDLTVGVVGAGRIGSAVVDRLRGFGCRVLVNDVRPDAAADAVPLDELLRLSDVVTLHTPLDAGTHHLLDGRRIELMKPGAVLVNTGRGPLVDTETLVPALETGRLGGAALDVLEGEDGIFYADRRSHPPRDELFVRLHRLTHVLISPHIAYDTDHALRDAVQGSITACLQFERNRHG